MKCKIWIALLSFIIFSSVTTFAQEYYDYREEHISDYEEYEEICEMEEDILDDFANDVYIDMTRGVKVLSFDVDVFNEQLKTKSFIECLANCETYSWRIPVQDGNEKGIGYVTVYRKDSGKWEHYTASFGKESESQQVDYIFDAEVVERILSKNSITPMSVYAIGVSNIGLDCIVVEMKDAVRIIPFAARPEFLDLENGKLYTKEEMSQRIQNYLEESSYDYNLPIVYIVIVGIIVGGIVGVIVFVKKKSIINRA